MDYATFLNKVNSAEYDDEPSNDQVEKPKTKFNLGLVKIIKHVAKALGLATSEDVLDAKVRLLQYLRDEFTRISRKHGEYCVRGAVGALRAHKVGEKLGEFMSVDDEIREIRKLLDCYANATNTFFKDEISALDRIAEINGLDDEEGEEVDEDIA